MIIKLMYEGSDGDFLIADFDSDESVTIRSLADDIKETVIEFLGGNDDNFKIKVNE